jgi:hypothetical protein
MKAKLGNFLKLSLMWFCFFMIAAFGKFFAPWHCVDNARLRHYGRALGRNQRVRSIKGFAQSKGLLNQGGAQSRDPARGHSF